MDENRLWVRATDTSGHSIIWMEREYWTEARKTVITNMTNAVLNYLYGCGVHADELGENYDELDSLLRAWWDRKNSFRRRDDPAPDGYDKYRVFWRPADGEYETHEGAGEAMPVSAPSAWWLRATKYLEERWAKRKRSR